MTALTLASLALGPLPLPVLSSLVPHSLQISSETTEWLYAPCPAIMDICSSNKRGYLFPAHAVLEATRDWEQVATGRFIVSSRNNLQKRKETNKICLENVRTLKTRHLWLFTEQRQRNLRECINSWGHPFITQHSTVIIVYFGKPWRSLNHVLHPIF